MAEQLPDFNDVLPSQYSLVLIKSGSLVGQIDFAKRSPSTGAPRRWWLKPSRAVKQPTRWRQWRDGNLCPSCRQRADEADRTRMERDAVIRTKRADMAKRAHARSRRTGQDVADYYLARELQVLPIVRRAPTRFNLDAHWAAEQGVVVRMCEHCVDSSAYVITSALDAVPSRYLPHSWRWMGKSAAVACTAIILVPTTMIDSRFTVATMSPTKSDPMPSEVCLRRSTLLVSSSSVWLRRFWVTSLTVIGGDLEDPVEDVDGQYLVAG